MIGDARITVVVGDSRAARAAAARACARMSLSGTLRLHAPPAVGWLLHRDVTPAPDQTLSSGTILWVRDLHEAFAARQSPGTRLILTQSTYQLQRWITWLEPRPGVRLVADADEEGLRRSAPEAFAGRGPWTRIAIVRAKELAPSVGESDAGEPEPAAHFGLHAAFSQPDAQRRLSACLDAVLNAPGNPAPHLACASVFMELERLDDARASLERAATLAPDWEAVHFEMGKLWLRAEETERAAGAFAEAGRLMPTFAAAFSNLGAALGELDRGDEALAALQHALEYDPASHPVMNNLGAVYREMGRLAEAESSFQRVIELAPAFVFGYYNLAHTLFLGGRFAESRDAYVEGMRRDQQKNARQAARLAVARTAAGDPSGAIDDLDALGHRVPVEAMPALMQEAESTLTALSGVPGVDAAGLARVLAWVRRYSS